MKLFDVAKEPREIFELQKDTDVEYFIDGKNFKEFGVFVSKSAGLVGRLERKEALQVNWDNYHGIVRDKKRPRYKERNITLDCFIEASGRAAYVEWVNLFFPNSMRRGTTVCVWTMTERQSLWYMKWNCWMRQTRKRAGDNIATI